MTGKVILILMMSAVAGLATANPNNETYSQVCIEKISFLYVTASNNFGGQYSSNILYQQFGVDRAPMPCQTSPDALLNTIEVTETSLSCVNDIEYLTVSQREGKGVHRGNFPLFLKCKKDAQYPIALRKRKNPW